VFTRVVIFAIAAISFTAAEARAEWSESQRSTFLAACLSGQPQQFSQTAWSNYCDCYLSETESAYPDYNAVVSMSEAQGAGQRMALACRGALGN
jgi:hypothetical protein